MHLLIMGPPGAGKGTQAARLATRYRIPAISTGDIFRAMRTADTPLAHQVRTIMASGGYVTDDITNAIVADRLNQPDCREGFLLDGYPRTLDQVRTLDALLGTEMKSIDAVIALHADVDEVVTRLLLRAETEGRSDDDEPTIRVRQQIYAEQTAPLLAVYRERGLLIDIDALGSVEAVSSRLTAGLERHLTRVIDPSGSGRL
jgi:adenylate kinase